jgi:hypothetical protein
LSSLEERVPIFDPASSLGRRIGAHSERRTMAIGKKRGALAAHPWRPGRERLQRPPP